MRFICVYTNKFKSKNIDFKQDFDNAYYFNPAETVGRFMKEDHTDEELSSQAVNAYIFTKVRRAFDSKTSDKMFYVIESLEESVLVDIQKMVREVSGNFEQPCPIDFFILEEDIHILKNFTPKMKEIIDMVIIYEQFSNTSNNISFDHRYFLDDNYEINVADLDEIEL